MAPTHCDEDIDYVSHAKRLAETGCNAWRFSATGSSDGGTLVDDKHFKSTILQVLIHKKTFCQLKTITETQRIAESRRSVHTARFIATATRHNSTCSSKLQADRRCNRNASPA